MVLVLESFDGYGIWEVSDDIGEVHAVGLLELRAEEYGGVVNPRGGAGFGGRDIFLREWWAVCGEWTQYH